MKKAALILFSLLMFPSMAYAQTPPPERIPENLNFLVILENLVDWMFSILIIVAAIFLVIAGFSFITSSGDPEKIARARNFVLFSLVGVAVGVAARSLISFVRLIIGG